MADDEPSTRRGYVPSDSDPPPRGLMKRAQALAGNLGMDRAERLELAEMLLSRDVTSWSQLVHYDLVRLVDAMVGVGLYAVLKDVRDPCARCGQRESAAGPGGECRECKRAWDAWTAPPEAAEVIEDAIAEVLMTLGLTSDTVATVAGQMADKIGTAVLEALHAASYRVDHH